MAKQFLLASFLVLSFAAFTLGQPESITSISPVYIPGTKLGVKNTVKTIETFKNVSAITKKGAEPNGTALITACEGCDCTSGGCDSGGCNSSSSGCDSCGCSSGGCDSGCDRVGRSFFGRLRERSPFKVNITSGQNSGDCGCDSCGQCSCDSRTGLARLLPLTIKLTTNHCSRYISVFGGYHDLEDYDGNGGGGGSRLIEFNDGYLFGFTRGKRFANNIRTENEVTFRHNTNDSYSTGNFVGMDFVPTATFDSIESVYSISSMRNVLYDFNDLGTRTIPYIGLGVGGIYIEGDIVTPALGRRESINDMEFAYQLIAGATRKFSRDAEGYVEYRYFGSTNVGVVSVAGADFSGNFDYQSNNVVFGLRYTIPNKRCCN